MTLHNLPKLSSKDHVIATHYIIGLTMMRIRYNIKAIVAYDETFEAKHSY